MTSPDTPSCRNGIFGIYSRQGSPIPTHSFDAMKKAMSPLTALCSRQWLDSHVGIGEVGISSPVPGESPAIRTTGDLDDRIAIVTSARVDNRSELGQALGLSITTIAEMSDHDLVTAAYLRWGEDSPQRIFGDWAFAVWEPEQRRLFLARDHFGITSLYYYVDDKVIAFASERKALLALDFIPVELDELYLAQVLVVWPSFHGERTVHKPIRHLPPAHTLAITANRFESRLYWQLENTPRLRFTKREDYTAAFRDIFDAAVKARLRSTDSPVDNRPVAVSLSGGLDSGAVAATAAYYLKKEGRRLQAFTSVPQFEVGNYMVDCIVNELSYARMTADFVGNIDLHPVSAASLSPIRAIRLMLQLSNEPAHAAGNLYWMMELRRAAQESGCNIFLIGRAGNGGISWSGDLFSQPLSCQLRNLGMCNWLKESVKRITPSKFLALRQYYNASRNEWYRSSAIRPDFAQRLRLLERRLDDPLERFSPNPLEQRMFLKPGRNSGGAFQAKLAAAYGLDVRDPTADARVLAFTFSVPDNIFIDPKNDMDRWLVRETMKGMLPDEVRLNRCRGRQGADYLQRLRACAGEVEEALNELEHGPASQYLDVNYMRQTWKTVQSDDTLESFRKSDGVLTRGIMAGIFVNNFYSRESSR